MSRGNYAVFYKPNVEIEKMDCDDLPKIYKGDVEWETGMSYDAFIKKAIKVAGAKGSFYVNSAAGNIFEFTSISQDKNDGVKCMMVMKRQKPTKSKIPAFDYSFLAQCKSAID